MRRIHVVFRCRGWWWPRIVDRGFHERATGAGERVQRRPQAFGRPGDGGLGGARASRQGVHVPAAVSEQRVRVLGALQEQRPGHDAVEEQRAGQHTAAVRRPGRSFPGGQDIRVARERDVQAPVGEEPDQLRSRVDQTRFRPEHSVQVNNIRIRGVTYSNFRIAARRVFYIYRMFGYRGIIWGRGREMIEPRWARKLKFCK